MKALVILFILVTAVTEVFPTAQYPDNIIYNGKEYMLHSNPLEAYFEKHPEKRPKGGVMSTALWRGYVATFEIRENALFVKDITIEKMGMTNGVASGYEWHSVLDDVFPEVNERRLDWLTGLLVLPHGKIKDYVHMGYASTYSKYILLEIHQGAFKAERRFNHKQYTQFKRRQFQAFRETEEYRKLVEELKSERGQSEEDIERFLKDFVISYSSRFLDKKE